MIGGEVDDLQASIGAFLGGTGNVSVFNNGMWFNTNGLIVGDQGRGTLNIESGGIAVVELGQGAQVGNQPGATGVVNVQGQFNLTQDLSIGTSGTGTMTISAGGAVASGNGHIAQNMGSNGTVTVTGMGGMSTQGGPAPSSWGVDGTLYVGEGGTGTLTVSNGGQISSRDGFVGKLQGSIGTATITDPGSLWFALLAGGTGTITVGGNGSQGTLNVLNSGTVAANSVVVEPGGTLNGAGGMIIANIVNAGGTVTPGDATGTLSITGNYTQNSGTLLFEIDGSAPGQFDQLLVSGQAIFDGGTIDVDFGTGFDTMSAVMLDLLTADLGLENLGAIVDVSGLPPGFEAMVDFTANGFGLDITPQQTAPVPEPDSLLLLGPALLAIWRRRPHRFATEAQRTP